MSIPQISKTLLSTYTEEEGSREMYVDTIEYDGHLWLVPEWLDNQDEGTTTPVRIVRPIRQGFVKTRPSETADYHLTDPIPKGVLSGLIPPESEHAFLVIEHPRIRIRGAYEGE